MASVPILPHVARPQIPLPMCASASDQWLPHPPSMRCQCASTSNNGLDLYPSPRREAPHPPSNVCQHQQFPTFPLRATCHPQ
ncbi:hypothetical protein BC827DRAFT_1226567 [Russula dissimulans]|nr:hypothetical protein BC827DRAFT_1226567 [Russula dissimulans]